jgi:hypothetical protein
MGGSYFADPNIKLMPAVASHMPLRKKIIAKAFNDFDAVMVISFLL